MTGNAARWSHALFVASMVSVSTLAGSLGAMAPDASGPGLASRQRDASFSPPSHTLRSEANISHDVRRRIGALQIPFVRNQGQAQADVAFHAATFGGTIIVTRTGEIVYALSQAGGQGGSRGVALHERLVGGTVRRVEGERRAATAVNYFTGSDRSKWVSRVATYDVVSLGEVYNGVEMKLEAHGNTAEKLFYVHPGGRPEQIRLRLHGGKGLTVTGTGELEVETALGPVRFSKPVAYQAGATREPVSVRYVVKGDEYGFAVGDYDQTRDLVIDPILASTFLGRSGASALAVSEDGSVYVAGSTTAADFPGITPRSPDGTIQLLEAFVAKMDENLSSIESATFLGGSSNDAAAALAIDSTGNVYVAGRTRSADFPGITPGAADNTMVTETAFIARLNGNLNSLEAATFLGGSGGDWAYALVVDGTGTLYVAGYTGSQDFPGIGPASADHVFAVEEVFVARLDGHLRSVLAATFLGGSLGESRDSNSTVALALDLTGHVYVAGTTRSSDFPGVRAGSADFIFAGIEAFVAKLDAGLTSILAATFLGGSGGTDEAYALALDTSAHVFVTGVTDSSNFPGIRGSSADNTYGLGEAFVVKLDPDLRSVMAATFLGGSGNGVGSVQAEQGRAITVDNVGNVYVAGSTPSSDFPGVNASSADITFVFPMEAFVAKLNPDLSAILGATFLGGSGNDEAFGVDLDANGNVYVMGQTDSEDLPGVGTGSADSTFDGRTTFVANLDSNLSREVPIPACTPQIVNSGVDLLVTDTSLDPRGGGPGTGAAGTFTIVANLTNTGTQDIFQPLKVIVAQLSPQNRLLSATEAVLGPGSRKQAIGAGADDVLTPNETIQIRFFIGLGDRSPFSFFVDVEGCVPAAP